MNANEFSDDYLNELLDKTSKVLNCDIHPPTDEFLESL